MLNNFLLADAGSTSSIIWLVILVVLVVVMLVMPSFTQKKRIKAYEEMKSRLRAGDKVQTIGGIVGKIVRIKETNGTQTVFIETGDKNSKMVIEFDINAISGVVEGLNNTNTNTPQTETPADEQKSEPEEYDVSFETESETSAEEKPAEEKKPANQTSKKKTNKSKK